MIENHFIELIRQENVEIMTDVEMKNHTSFRIGGKADAMCEVKDIHSLRAVILLCKVHHVPYFILGMGSNLLVSDKGIDGLVVKLGGAFCEIALTEENTLRAGAGCSLAKLCVFAKNMSLGGLEFAWGIPGSVGGAVYMNAGAYDGEMKQVVAAVDYMDSKGNVKRAHREDLDLSYRHSLFTDTDNIILSATFLLAPKSQGDIQERMTELMERRKAKQPINHPSAGSVFKRPEGAYAAALIEDCGLKGFSLGGAQVSPKHAGFIVNDNGASAQDVLDLIAHIQEVVREKKDIDLCCEVRFVGRK